MSSRLLDNIVAALGAGAKNGARHSGGVIAQVGVDVHLDDRHDHALEAFSNLLEHRGAALSRQVHGATTTPIVAFSEAPVDLTVYGPEIPTHTATGLELEVLNKVAAAEAAGGKEHHS